MAWTADGFWKPDDSDDTAANVAKVVDAGGPLMKQARGIGAMVANKRGLGNSSIAAGATQAEVLDKALAIGGQTAAQNSAKNLAALNANEQLKYGTTLQEMQDTSAKDRLGMQITSNEGIAAADRGSNEALTREKYALDERMQGASIASTEKLSSQQIAAELSRLQTQIASNEKLAAQGDAAAMARLQADLASQAKLQADKLSADKEMQQTELGSRSSLQTQIDAAALQRQREELANRTDLSAADRAAELARLDKQIASAQTIAAGEQAGATERQRMQTEGAAAQQAQADVAALQRQREELASRTDIATADRKAELDKLDKQIASSKELAQLDSTTRLNLGQMDTDRAREANATQAATSLQQSYLQAMAASMANENIPGDVRAAYQASIKSATEAGIGMVEQITGTDLAWGDNTLRPQSAPPAPPQDYSWNEGQSTRLADGTQLYKQADGSTLRIAPDGTQTILPAAAA